MESAGGVTHNGGRGLGHAAEAQIDHRCRCHAPTRCSWTGSSTGCKRDAELEIGYPVAFDFDYSALTPFLSFSLNNAGDPFMPMTYLLNSHEFEQEVVAFFAELARAPEDEWWGYVTNGSTEGNLYGLYLGRELLPDGIVYFSQDSHYSVGKNLHFLNMRHIMIRSQPNGEIDYDDLRETLRIRRDAPPIIFANIGTTMKEARDDIVLIRSILDDLAIESRYIHCDAALCGGYAAFLDPRPAWDFEDGADSIAISGHKFIGSPIPCGIVLARRGHVDRIGHSVAYIGSVDTTISGSRNGFTPLLMWYAIRSLGIEGLRRRIADSLAVAAYAEQTLQGNRHRRLAQSAGADGRLPAAAARRSATSGNWPRPAAIVTSSACRMSAVTRSTA